MKKEEIQIKGKYVYLQKKFNMKKILFSAAFLCGISAANAQAINEVKLNIFNTIALQSVEVGYEHFIDTNQSIGFEVHINDRFSYWTESKKEGKFKKFNTNSIVANYNIYFGGNDGEHASGFMLTPFLKYRFGNYERDRESIRTETDMNAFIIGLGGGYKLVKFDAFTVAPFISIARNFSEEVSEEFMGIEINGGVTIGYRF